MVLPEAGRPGWSVAFASFGNTKEDTCVLATKAITTFEDTKSNQKYLRLRLHKIWFTQRISQAEAAELLSGLPEASDSPLRQPADQAFQNLSFMFFCSIAEGEEIS